MNLRMMPFILTSVIGMNLRNQGILDGVDIGDGTPTQKPFIYSPSNKNTRPPATFADEIVVDDAYHELVPALQVLSDLTTRAPAAVKFR